VNVAAARLGMKSAIDAIGCDVAGAGADLDVALPTSSISMSPLPALILAGPDKLASRMFPEPV
jgi:hypothetical protein